MTGFLMTCQNCQRMNKGSRTNLSATIFDKDIAMEHANLPLKFGVDIGWVVAEIGGSYRESSCWRMHHCVGVMTKN